MSIIYDSIVSLFLVVSKFLRLFIYILTSIFFLLGYFVGVIIDSLKLFAVRKTEKTKDKRRMQLEYLDWYLNHDSIYLWKDYSEYLRSDVWRAKRGMVLDLAGHRCEIKGTRCSGRALQVHHSQYTSWGHESLSSLKATCIPCHEDQHPDKPSQNTTEEEADAAMRALRRSRFDDESKAGAS
jgi:5-methylcytosine-specific restriction endonuclease McrA